MVAGRVFSRLVEDVLSGRYEPGEKLPTQRALAAELDVNMASVREAVKRLEQLGLVEVRHGDAMRVTDWRTSGGLDVIAHVLFAAGGVDPGKVAPGVGGGRAVVGGVPRPGGAGPGAGYTPPAGAAAGTL